MEYQIKPTLTTSCMSQSLYVCVTAALFASHTTTNQNYIGMRRSRNQHTFKKKQSSRKHIKETAWGKRGGEIKILALMAE